LSRDVGLFIGENLPQGLFQDNSGIVTELGPGVTKFAVGDRVFNQGFFMGEGVGSQEYSIMEVDLAAKIPEALSFDVRIIHPGRWFFPSSSFERAY
jgi:NADPH:quinone reductase